MAEKATVTVVDHPLVQHKLTLMRKTETSTTNFRTLAQELSLLLGYEVLRDLPLTQVPIETPLQPMNAPTLEGKKVVFISVLRAGAGILDGFLRLVPAARVGYIGLFRDPKTLQPVEYYFKIPSEMEDREAIVVDPMLATGNSAVAAVARVKETNPRKIKFVCLLAAPEGIAVMQEAHPDVPIFTACIDERLNDKGYILPGLGDAGDRLFGTK